MDPTKFILREAVIEDLPVLKIFEQEIIEYERPYASNLKKENVSYYDLKALILQEDAYVLVATYNEEIVGSGYALTKKSKPYFEPELFAYLGFMFVKPAFRGKGINGKITNQLIEWAKSKGLTEIQLDVYAENESALKAYQKIGFQPDLLKMRFKTN